MANPAKIPGKFFEGLGRRTVAGLDEMGYAAAIFFEAIYWTLTGWRYRQPVRFSATFGAMMQFGVTALPIATLLAATIGLMLATGSVLIRPSGLSWAVAALVAATLWLMLRTKRSPLWAIALGAVAGAAGWV